MRHFTPFPLVLLSFGLAAVACGGDDDEPSDTGAGGSSAGGSSAGGSGGSSAGGSSAGGSGGSSAGGSSAGGSGGSGGADGATLFEVTIENLEVELPLRQSGAVSIPEDADDAGPIGPGGSFELHFAAAPGDKLTFATMFGQSNDLFLAPDGDGIALFDDDELPVSGDVTDQVTVWDAGTEANQPLGEGSDQAPRQAAPDTGDPDSDDSVRMVGGTEYDNLPPVDEMFSATLMADDDGIHFTLIIENVSAEGDLMTSGDPTNIAFSPVAFAVSGGENVLFTEGEPASEQLERVAEDGNAMLLAEMWALESGILSPISPGVWAVHETGGLFDDAEPDPGMGLEHQAEDGDPSELADSLKDADFVVSSGVFDTPDGADDPGPATPGNKFSFELVASPGDKLSFATMFGQSNDLFYSPASGGIPLFDNDEPIEGDITDMVMLWDAGTEINEPPGLGPNQAPRQSGPDTGPDEDGDVMSVADGYSYASPSKLIKVTIMPQ